MIKMKIYHSKVFVAFLNEPLVTLMPPVARKMFNEMQISYNV